MSAVVGSSTSVNVSWEEVPKFDRNGLILGYKVREILKSIQASG